MSLKKFKSSEIVLTDLEAWRVLVFFFGGNASTQPNWLTANDRSFAQALLIEAVDRSYQISWIQSIWQSTARPGASIKGILAKLAVKAMKDWLQFCKPSDLKDAKIYMMVKNQLTMNWRTAWAIRIDTGEPVY